EVGVEGRTYQGVQLNGLALDHLRLESLYTQTVECRGTVEEYRVTLEDILEYVQNHWIFAVNNLFGRFYGLYNATLNHLADNKRLVKLGSHVFRQTALMQFQLWTYHDNRTTGIVDTLTQ